MKENIRKVLSGAVSAFTAASLTLSSAVAPAADILSLAVHAGDEDHTFHIDSSYKQPNIVVVLLDDTGINELGCYGNTFSETPHIDRIASEGTQFANYYTQPVCSPSRSCMLTGEGTVRTGITNFLDVPNSLYLDHQEFTLLPSLLQQAGYTTGLVGKWHLSAGYDNYPAAGSPYDAGFDYISMTEQKHIGYGDYFYPYDHIPQAQGKSGDYLVDAMNADAVAYIYDHADDDQPFFLYLSHYATHVTLDAPQDTVDYFQQKRGSTGGKEISDRNPYLAAMLKHVDDGVGAIDAALKDLNIDDNTMLVIASDNGGFINVTENGVYRGGKAQLYEGGLRDPLIIRWPAYSTDAHVNEDLTSVIDFYQTFGEAAGIPASEVPKNSGLSLLPLLKKGGSLDRDTLYWAYLRETNVTQTTPVKYDTALTGGGAIRIGDYKYIESWECYRRELYNLAVDPGEENNIIENNYALAEEMARELYRRLKADTVGKVFHATFDDKENYRWNTSGSMGKANGVFSANGMDRAAVAREDLCLFDFDLTTSVKVGSGGSAGVLFRNNVNSPDQDDFTAYAVTLDASNDKVRFVNLKNQRSYTVASADLSLAPNRVYQLRVVADSDRFDIFVDSAFVMTVYDESYAHGGVGFYSEYASASFDDLDVLGIAGERDTTKAQVNLKPCYENNIRADYHWVSAEPVKKSGVWFVDADALLGTLAVERTVTDDTLTATVNGLRSVCTAGSTAITIDGKDYTLSNAPYTEENVFYVPVEDYAQALQLAVTVNGDVTDISAAESETITHTDSRVAYSSGWSNVGSAHRSTKKDEYAELTFSGCGVSIFFDRGKNAGIIDIYIDGEYVGSADIYNNGAVNNSAFETDGLDPGIHTVKIVNTGTHNPAGGGTNVNLSRFVIKKFAVAEPTPTATKIENTDENIDYKGSWKTADNGMRTATAGDSASYTFEGTSVEVYFGVGTGAGIFEVYLDGEKVAKVDGYREIAATVCLFASDPLPYGKHTVKIVNTGEKNSASKNKNVNLAYLIVRSDLAGVLPGDANGDGEIGADDLTILARHVAKIESITDPNLLAACCFAGGTDAGADDLTTLARMVAHID